MFCWGEVALTTDTTKPDGRSLRAQRTRRAIVDAHLTLMLGGDPQPTAARIAATAGVSVRALWSHFRDLEQLFAAAGERTLEVQYAGHVPIPPGLPLDERVESFCRQRARMLESIAGASRAAQLRLPFSPQLRANRERHNDRLRAELAEVFAPELAVDETLLTALQVATAWPAWTCSRDDLGLDIDQATEVMSRTVGALLERSRDEHRNR
ncbi:TetR family transcriptional regulator [Actinophytocola xinjiangensis]|uniref:TetR family transcriptional regulator n=1 Tax=Actinophytocola xinjiangensis TaxID=485602 RepID=A0A7Z0WQ65_9PSEU|nr:TetR family transcriptional regulator [Actinophytocola xinjiangensis]